MGSLGEFFRNARERRKERRATRGERAQRRAEANRIRLEHKRKSPTEGGGGG